MEMSISFLLLIFLFLMIAFGGWGISIRKTRLTGVLLAAGLLLALFLLVGLVGWRVSVVPSHRRMAQWNEYSQSTGNVISVEQPAEQYDVEQVKGNPAGSQIAIDQPAFSEVNRVPGPRVSPKWFALGVLAVAGLVFVGGLVLIIVMLSNPKTRVVGISLLVAGPILLLLVAAGLYLTIFTDFGGVPNIVNLSANNVPPQSPISLPPGYNIPLPPGYNIPPAPNFKFTQSMPAYPATNSKQEIQAFESVIYDFSKALANPLKIETKDILSDKVSTLSITVRDIGQVTVSGSSLLINSIGQALAKAMTDRIRENNAQADITQANTGKNNPAATVPVAATPVQPTAEKTASKKDASTGNSPSKDRPVENTTIPSDVAVESAASSKANSSETAKTALAPERPDWVGKPAYLYRSGSQLPDYYPAEMIKSKSWGDSYLMNVTVGPYTSRLECDANAPAALSDALCQFAEAYYRRPTYRSIYRDIAPEQLRKLVVTEWEERVQSSVGLMTQLHLLVNFDQNAKVLIDNVVNSVDFSENAAVAGVIFGGIWLFLAYIWAYLKIDLATKGAYRKRLRFAFGSVILVIMLLALVVAMS